MHKPGKNITIALAVTNCICHDQRVLKMAGVLKKPGTDVTIIGRYKGECCEKIDLGFKTKRFRMLFKNGFLFYKFYNVRLFFYLLFHRFDIIVSNDLDTLPATYFASKLRRSSLVFDSHEYFTGVPELQNRPLVKGVWKTFEKFILPKIKHCITVSESIAQQYSEEYKITPVVIRNCARGSGNIKPFSKRELGIDPGHLLLVLQGTGINRERGSEELLEALKITGGVSLMIIGSGDILPDLKAQASSENLAGRIVFIPRLPWEEMMRYTKTADAGVSLDKNMSLNHKFSLPNKLFDYVSAGIPVIAGDLPEVTKIITAYCCGIVIPEITPEEINQVFKMLNENRDLLLTLKNNAKKASEVLTWEKESGIAEEFYQKIMGRSKQ